MPKRDKLTPTQEAFVEQYLISHYISDAAEALEISERTARRWFATPLVQQAIETARQERREQIHQKIEECMDLAVELMHKTLHNAVYPKHGRDSDQEMKYVALLFRYVSDQHEIDALKKRVAELEAHVEVQEVQEPTVEGRLLRRID
jgi:polyhydroxyalkanoate synthesis regulator phasin